MKSPNKFSEKFKAACSGGRPEHKSKLPLLYKLIHDDNIYIDIWETELAKLTEILKTAPQKIEDLQSKIIDSENERNKFMAIAQEVEGFPTIEL